MARPVEGPARGLEERGAQLRPGQVRPHAGEERGGAVQVRRGVRGPAGRQPHLRAAHQRGKQQQRRARGVEERHHRVQRRGGADGVRRGRQRRLGEAELRREPGALEAGLHRLDGGAAGGDVAGGGVGAAGDGQQPRPRQVRLGQVQRQPRAARRGHPLVLHPQSGVHQPLGGGGARRHPQQVVAPQGARVGAQRGQRPVRGGVAGAGVAQRELRLAHQVLHGPQVLALAGALQQPGRVAKAGARLLVASPAQQGGAQRPARAPRQRRVPRRVRARRHLPQPRLALRGAAGVDVRDGVEQLRPPPQRGR